jgi:hypothetical protein
MAVSNMRIQKPLKGKPRRHVSSCVSKILREHVEDAALEFNCSKSFIIAVAVAKFFGVKNQEVYWK